MVPTVGMPWRQIRTSVFGPSVNVWFWLWPSSERSAGRLPASTCTETRRRARREQLAAELEQLALAAGRRAGRDHGAGESGECKAC